MLSVPINSIKDIDLKRLIDDQVQESKTIEYKRDLPDKTDRGKDSFLSAICSFANTEGGDLIYGISAIDGVPVEIFGIGEDNEDAIRLRLEEMSRSGIDPRLPSLDLRFVEVQGLKVLVVRVGKSWKSPHRVILNRHYWGRHSAGKFSMDTDELRRAFSGSIAVEESIETYRFNRVNAIFQYQVPTGVTPGCKMILHIIPLSAFATTEKLDIARNEEIMKRLLPIGRQAHQQSKITLHGVLNYTNPQDGRSAAYTEVSRRGIIEAVYSFSDGPNDAKYIHSVAFEEKLIQALTRYLPQMVALELQPPFYIYLSFVEMTGYSLRVPYVNGFGYQDLPCDQHILTIPEIVVSDPSFPAQTILKPIFDMVWNAFGFPGSQNYDDLGAWNPRKE